MIRRGDVKLEPGVARSITGWERKLKRLDRVAARRTADDGGRAKKVRWGARKWIGKKRDVPRAYEERGAAAVATRRGCVSRADHKPQSIRKNVRVRAEHGRDRHGK